MESDKTYSDCAGCDYSDFMAAEERGFENVTYCKKHNGFVREKYDCQYATYVTFTKVAQEIIEEK